MHLHFHLHFIDFYGLPNYLGKIRNLDKIDDKFFGILPVQANELDPQIRILLQTTYEAIIDAGNTLECVSSNSNQCVNLFC